MVQLDLVELADLARPEQIAEEILRQNPLMPVPVPIEALAYAAGISEIEAFASTGFEGALITNDTKSSGAIFFSSGGSRARQRFTIGHELGHFLLPWHRQSNFQCTAEDISSRARREWEMQANQFSAEVLLPAPLVKARLRQLKEPELVQLTQMRDEFETSLEATARRAVELNDYPCAVVFSKDNIIRYAVVSPVFEPRLCVRKGSRLPDKSPSRGALHNVDDCHEIDAYWWLEDQRDSNDLPDCVWEQTLAQQSGHKVTLITY